MKRTLQRTIRAEMRRPWTGRRGVIPWAALRECNRRGWYNVRVGGGDGGGVGIFVEGVPSHGESMAAVYAFPRRGLGHRLVSAELASARP